MPDPHDRQSTITERANAVSLVIAQRVAAVRVDSSAPFHCYDLLVEAITEAEERGREQALRAGQQPE